MGKIINIDQELLQTAVDAFDDMIDTFGKNCKLIYKSKETICPNCIVDPKTGRSTGRPKPNPIIPFTVGTTCPICDGRGKLVGTEGYSIVKMSINWNPREWITMWPQAANADSIVRLAGGVATSRGYITDLPKILRADSVVLDIDNNFMNNHFVLSGEPISPGNIVKNRYFTALWKRAG
jgi:hypothetical protein